MPSLHLVKPGGGEWVGTPPPRRVFLRPNVTAERPAWTVLRDHVVVLWSRDQRFYVRRG